MARDVSGVYTLPTGNPVISGTVIESAWANTTMDDMSSALTDSLSRTARGGMQAQLSAINGTVVAPGYVFADSLTTGLSYDDITQELVISRGGTEVLRFKLSGVMQVPVGYAAVADNDLVSKGEMDAADTIGSDALQVHLDAVLDAHPMEAITGLATALANLIHADITLRDAADSHPRAAITDVEGVFTDRIDGFLDNGLHAGEYIDGSPVDDADAILINSTFAVWSGSIANIPAEVTSSRTLITTQIYLDATAGIQFCEVITKGKWGKWYRIRDSSVWGAWGVAAGP